MIAKLISFTFVLVLLTPLAGCGVKSSPDRPDGSTYPQQYPVISDKKKSRY